MGQSGRQELKWVILGEMTTEGTETDHPGSWQQGVGESLIVPDISTARIYKPAIPHSFFPEQWQLASWRGEHWFPALSRESHSLIISRKLAYQQRTWGKKVLALENPLTVSAQHRGMLFLSFPFIPWPMASSKGAAGYP